MAFDTPYSVVGKGSRIKAAGHGAVIRYISPNTQNFPHKRMTLAEVSELSENGIWVAGVYERMGNQAEMNPTVGAQHGNDAVAVYRSLGAPQGAVIFLAVDFDASDDEIQNGVVPYFQAAHEIIKAAGFQVGCYGSGAVCYGVSEAGFASIFWLAGAYGWSRSREMLEAGDWDVLQKPQKASCAGLDVDLDSFRDLPSLLGFWQSSG